MYPGHSHEPGRICQFQGLSRTAPGPVRHPHLVPLLSRFVKQRSFLPFFKARLFHLTPIMDYEIPIVNEFLIKNLIRFFLTLILFFSLSITYNETSF